MKRTMAGPGAVVNQEKAPLFSGETALTGGASVYECLPVSKNIQAANGRNRSAKLLLRPFHQRSALLFFLPHKGGRHGFYRHQGKCNPKMRYAIIPVTSA